MNWYLVLTPFNEYSAQDVGRMVLRPGDAADASLELQGYLRFVAPEFTFVGDTAVPKKKVRRGKSFEAGPPEVEPVEPVSGDAARGPDGAAD